MADPKPAGFGVWATLVRPGSGLDAEILAAWAAAVGAPAVPRAQPWTLHEGLMTVRVHSSTWAQELSLRRAEIMGRMESDLGGPRVTDLRFIVSPLDD